MTILPAATGAVSFQPPVAHAPPRPILVATDGTGLADPALHAARLIGEELQDGCNPDAAPFERWCARGCTSAAMPDACPKLEHDRGSGCRPLPELLSGVHPTRPRVGPSRRHPAPDVTAVGRTHSDESSATACTRTTACSRCARQSLPPSCR